MIGVQWDDAATLRDAAGFEPHDMSEDLDALAILVTGKRPLEGLDIIGCDWSLYRALLGAAVAAKVWGADMSAGRKDDAGKPRWSLMPWRALASVVDVLTFGARKYAPDGWRKVPNGRERYHDALERHLLAWRMGEALDPESGLPHLAHAACCLLFLLAFELHPEGR